MAGASVAALPGVCRPQQRCAPDSWRVGGQLLEAVMLAPPAGCQLRATRHVRRRQGNEAPPAATSVRGRSGDEERWRRSTVTRGQAPLRVERRALLGRRPRAGGGGRSLKVVDPHLNGPRNPDEVAGRTHRLARTCGGHPPRPGPRPRPGRRPVRPRHRYDRSDLARPPHRTPRRCHTPRRLSWHRPSLGQRRHVVKTGDRGIRVTSARLDKSSGSCAGTPRWRAGARFVTDLGRL
jgi:hypothetical protein